MEENDACYVDCSHSSSVFQSHYNKFVISQGKKIKTQARSSLGLFPAIFASPLSASPRGKVGPRVELREEDEHEGHDAHGQEADLPRVPTVDHAGHDRQRPEEAHDKLDQLEGGEVLLPPEEALERGAEGGEEVVGIHEGVDEGVEHGAEAVLAAGGIPGKKNKDS